MTEKYILDRSKAAVVVIDIQERLVPVMKYREMVITNTGHLLEAAKLLHIPVLVTEQYPRGLGPTVEEVKKALPSYEPIEKVTFDCCRSDGFSEAVASLKREQIILAGMETHVCVLQTCLSLLRENYTVHLPSDAVCSRKKEDYLTAKEMMRDAGAVITCTETVLFQLLEKAGTPEFKTISKRIK